MERFSLSQESEDLNINIYRNHDYDNFSEAERAEGGKEGKQDEPERHFRLVSVPPFLSPSSCCSTIKMTLNVFERDWLWEIKRGLRRNEHTQLLVRHQDPQVKPIKLGQHPRAMARSPLCFVRAEGEVWWGRKSQRDSRSLFRVRR
jgi:hypothetical protein